ncbi:MAG: DNA-processing protein DprA, partial [Bacteroidota bacterium]
IRNADPYALAEPDLDYIQGHNIQTCFYLDDHYPKRLLNVEDGPLLLYYKGDFDPNPGRTVAIVGTRKPTSYGISCCEHLVKDLEAYEVQIISGLAYGVDAVAHRSANQHEVENLAIMGTGINTIYPGTHRQLAQAIQDNGAVMTEYPLHTKADRENFPRRNRIIAAMADVTVVIQSAAKGGSLITAEYANAYHKDVFAYPGRATDEQSEGCNKLIKQNKAHLIESAADIGYIMRWEIGEDKPSPKQRELFVDLTVEEQRIVDLIKAKDEVSVDLLHLETRQTLSQLSAVLLGLELKGVIRSKPGSSYTLA